MKRWPSLVGMDTHLSYLGDHHSSIETCYINKYKILIRVATINHASHVLLYIKYIIVLHIITDKLHELLKINVSKLHYTSAWPWLYCQGLP